MLDVYSLEIHNQHRRACLLDEASQEWLAQQALPTVPWSQRDHVVRSLLTRLREARFAAWLFDGLGHGNA